MFSLMNIRLDVKLDSNDVLDIYWLLCAFIVIGTDDGEPWTVGDKWYIVFAGFYVPIIIGLFIGSYIKETGFFDKKHPWEH